MGFKLSFRRRKSPDFTLNDLRGIQVKLSGSYPEGFKDVEEYWLEVPFAKVKILTNGSEYFYALLEPELSEDEKNALKDLKERVLERVQLYVSDDDRAALFKAFKDVIYSEFKEVSLDTVAKLWYFLERDCFYAGPVTPLLKDMHIEDISCSGYDKPIFVYHNLYESIPTNVVMNEEELDNFVLAVAQRRGVEISVANPIADTTLYDGSRINLTFRKEVTDHGSTFTIRKVKNVPITPVDLIRWNAFSAEEMAFLWLCLESNGSMLFVGGTAAGKTTAMNATALFIPIHSKVVTIEDTREVMLPHKNWIPSVATDRIDMFALLRAALRQRPEYIIVGEVRGEEVEIMFQAMTLGHTCLSTVHGSSAEGVLDRLMSPPYSVPEALVQNLDLVVVVGRYKIGDRIVRRCSGIWMVKENVEVVPIFQWDGTKDVHRKKDTLSMLYALSVRTGRAVHDLERELEWRTKLLRNLAERGVDYKGFLDEIHHAKSGQEEEYAER